MLIVEGSRFAISDRMVFFPGEDQVRRLAADLGPLSLVRIRQTDVEVTDPNVIHSSVFRTACLDIAREDDALLAGMSKTSRNEIHKVERLGERMRVVHGGTDLSATFLEMYRSFVRAKGHTHPLSARRLQEYLRVSELWIAYVDGEPVCGHLLLVDAEEGRTRFLYEANTRFGGEELARLHSPINRYLHLASFRNYRERGLRLFDWGGIGDGEGPVARFKLSLGGEPRQDRSYVLAGAVARVAYRAFSRFR